MEALLAEDSCQTQEVLAESLGMTEQAISKRLKAMEMIQKQGKWVNYDHPKRRKSWGMPGHSSTSTARPNIHDAKVQVQLGVVYYDLLKPSKTITADRYRTQLMRLGRALKEKMAPVPRETQQSYPPAWQRSATCRKTSQDILGNAEM